MRAWSLAVAGCVCLALAGCRTDPEIARLERDNRLKEDEIYRLRWRIEDLQEAMQSCPAPGAAGITAPPVIVAPLESGPSLGSAAPSAAPRAPATKSVPSGAPPAELPKIELELPKEPLPKGQVPERFRMPEQSKTPPGGDELAPPSRLRPASSGSRRLKPEVDPLVEGAAPGDRSAAWAPVEQGPIVDPGGPAADTWRPTAAAAAGQPEDSAARTASRPPRPSSQRPAWSPERR
jgi:hypothetical protein